MGDILQMMAEPMGVRTGAFPGAEITLFLGTFLREVLCDTTHLSRGLPRPGWRKMERTVSA